MTPGDRLLNFALSDAQGVRRIFYFEVAGAPSVFFAAESFRSPELAEALQDFPAQLDRLRGAGLEVYFLSRDEPAVLRGLTEAWGTDAAAFSDPGGQVLERLLAPEPPAFPETRPFRPKLATFALDPNQRTLAVFRRPPLGDHVSGCLEAVETWRRGEEPPTMLYCGAPVLLLPRVFDEALCRRLIEAWRSNHREGGLYDGQENVLDPDKKRNLEHLLADPALDKRITQTLARRIGPEVAKVFNYRSPYGFEGFNILSYRDDRQDFFGLHRDTLRQERPRRFALSLNLNDDYEGGALRFPEYGPHSYSPPAGAALVFSTSLLHEALPVTKGQRWVLVTFLCDPDSAPPPPA